MSVQLSAYENNPNAVHSKINFINSLYQELDKSKTMDKSFRSSLNPPKSEERSFRFSSNITITPAPKVLRKKVSTQKASIRTNDDDDEPQLEMPLKPIQPTRYDPLPIRIQTSPHFKDCNPNHKFGTQPSQERLESYQSSQQVEDDESNQTCQTPSYLCTTISANRKKSQKKTTKHQKNQSGILEDKWNLPECITDKTDLINELYKRVNTKNSFIKSKSNKKTNFIKLNKKPEAIQRQRYPTYEKILNRMNTNSDTLSPFSRNLNLSRVSSSNQSMMKTTKRQKHRVQMSYCQASKQENSVYF